MSRLAYTTVAFALWSGQQATKIPSIAQPNDMRIPSLAIRRGLAT